MQTETTPPEFAHHETLEQKSSAGNSTRVWGRGALMWRSLRARLTLGVALPLILALTAFSVIHYFRERHLLEEQLQLEANQLAAITLGSLRHAMLINDGEHIEQILADLEQLDNLQQVQIIDNSGLVWASSDPAVRGTQYELGINGCDDCHPDSTAARTLTSIQFETFGLVRSAFPIVNETECAVCHTADEPHLGVMLIDYSMTALDKHLRADLRQDLLFSGGTVIFITLAFFWILHWQIVRRVESFQKPLSSYAAGDYQARLPHITRPTDELGELAIAFNQVADELERRNQEEQERQKVRQLTIIEERERIARELHDGLAQLLGFVKTKVMAVRLLIKHEQLETADKQLHQLENAAKDLYTETRQAILGLKMAGEIEAGLARILRDFVPRFGELCDVSIDLDISPSVDSLSLPTETELQLLRVVQEAITNVHKHSQAEQAWIRLDCTEKELELEIRDNGTGFSLKQANGNSRSTYGLDIMRERSEAIGATFRIDTRPGYGTAIQVTLPIEGDK